MSTAVIIGGGISGLLAARILRPRHDQVFLVEKEPRLGGLLRSETNEMGHSFDQGTHFIIPTSIAEANRQLYEDLDEDRCYVFRESLLEGCFFNGRLNEASGCLDTRTLSPRLQAQGLAEILNTRELDFAPANLEENLIAVYGKTFTRHVFTPALKKLTGMKLRDLHPSAHQSFLLTRLIVLDAHGSREVKKSVFFDDKIAWANSLDGSSDIVKHYPKSGGVGVWIDGIEARVRKEGVKVLTETSVSSVKLNGGKVKKISLETGETLTCDEAVWTIPPVFFLRAAGIPFRANPPKFRGMALLHFTFDAEIKSDRHWICCYDPDFASFRITLYPNITKSRRNGPPHHLTVEVLSDEISIEVLKSRVKKELVEMGIIPAKSKTLFEDHSIVRPGWPILTPDFIDDAGALFALAQESAKNVTFVGRGKKENAHFLSVVLEDVYSSLA